MKSSSKSTQIPPAEALEKAVRRSWRAWRKLARQVRREPASRGLVHRFRIATRRLFAVESLLGGTAEVPIHDRLETAFRAAGRIRDLQVCRRELVALEDRFEAAPAIRRMLRQRLPLLAHRFRHEIRTLDIGLLRHDVRRLRAGLRSRERTPRARHAQAHAMAAALGRHRDAREQLQRIAREIPAEVDDNALHALRIRLKGVRYEAELLGTESSIDERTTRAIDAGQRALGAVTDLRALLREIDRCRLHGDANAAELASLRRHVLQVERRRIRALFGGAATAAPAKQRRAIVRALALIR